MKNIYLLVISIVGLLTSCEREGIPTYNDLTSNRYLYLYRAETDSTETSFFFYPGETTIEFPISVRCTGRGDQDQTYKIAVVDEYTTAPAETYEIPENPVMRAGRDRDTCYIKLKYNPILDTQKVRLVVEIKDSENFLAGRTEYRVAIIWFHNIIAQPKWWNSNVINYYLGKYSDEKYQLFLDVIKVDLTNATDSELRNYSLLFKKYLNDEKEAGRTVYEKDGSEMEVAVLGNLI